MTVLSGYRPRNFRLVAVPFDHYSAYVGYCDGMDVERTIDDIEQLQEMLEAPDIDHSAQATSPLRIEGTMRH